MLLLVFVSHALGSVHVATHGNADVGDCALCATYGNASAPPADTGVCSIPPAGSDAHLDAPRRTDAASAVLCKYQRGPPLAESA